MERPFAAPRALHPSRIRNNVSPTYSFTSPNCRFSEVKSRATASIDSKEGWLASSGAGCSPRDTASISFFRLLRERILIPISLIFFLFYNLVRGTRISQYARGMLAWAIQHIRTSQLLAKHPAQRTKFLPYKSLGQVHRQGLHAPLKPTMTVLQTSKYFVEILAYGQAICCFSLRHG